MLDESEPVSVIKYFSAGNRWTASLGLLPQVKELKYVRILFASNGEMEFKVDRWIQK